MPNAAQLIVGCWFFFLGCVMGSFYNVLVDRIPEGKTVLSGRSACASCGQTLRWNDLVPVFSFLLLKGRCRYCGQKLSPRYLLSELLNGGLFLLSFVRFSRTGNVPQLLTELSLWSMLFVVSFMDWNSGVIADAVLLVFSALGAAARLWNGAGALSLVFGALTGFGLYGLVYLAARLFYGREGFGQGDVLLLTAVGVFLGPLQTLLCGVLAFYICLLFLLAGKLFRKEKLSGTELPFGPSVCLAAGVMLLFGSGLTAFLGRLMGF